jgi:hypothetical protein
MERPTNISWPSLAGQFGTGYKAVRQFKADFMLALSAACAAYPDAKVEIIDRGVRLLPSPPPISKVVHLPAYRKAEGKC